MSNANSWLDFAQRSREEGGLGLEKHQAAGIVGNLVHESGPDISPWGVTGDNGTAFGSAQWRGDRFTGLQNHARENGLDFKTPEAQQAWMRRELDTTENRAYKALLAATTPEDAARAFDQHYERSDGSARDRRAASARQFYGGAPVDGPTAIDQAMGRTGSPKMAYADDEYGALRPQPTPGALNGGAPAQPSWLETLGQTLKEVAPGIAQDPDNKNALQKSADSSRKVAQASTWSTHYDPATGMATQVNDRDPSQRRQFQYGTPKPEKDPVKQAADIGRIKADQEYTGELAKNGAASRASIDALAPVQAALSNPSVYQGAGGELAYQKDKIILASPFGSNDPDLKKRVEDAGVALAGINKMVQEGRTLNGGMPGSLSDKDLEFLKNAQASLSNSPETNQRILQIYKQLHERRIALDNEAQTYAASNPYGVADAGFKRQINEKWTRENAARDKALAEAEKAAPAGAAKAAGASKPFNPADVQWSRNTK